MLGRLVLEAEIRCASCRTDPGEVCERKWTCPGCARENRVLVFVEA